MSPLGITLIILLLTIIAFLSGKVPMSIVSMGIILALIIFKILPVQRAFSGFINIYTKEKIVFILIYHFYHMLK